MFIGSSFEAAGLSTYIPLVFDYRPTYVNSAGYPNTNLPSSAAGAKHEQWHQTPGSRQQAHSRVGSFANQPSEKPGTIAGLHRPLECGRRVQRAASRW